MAKLSSTHIYGDLYVDGAIDGKVNKDSAGQQINTTYIKGLSVSGKTITYTKGDGTTGTITTQDTNTTYSAATQSAAGLMSAADKTKLDGIATGANKYTHPSYTAKSSGFYKVTVDASGHVSATAAVAKADITGLGIPAQDTTYSAATQSAAGLMSADDKKKLDGVAASANNYSHPNSGVTASSYGPSANASPAHSGTFSVPYITVNAAGHITSASTKTITLPADNNTWRGIQNNLTSDSTSDSLSAAQGKALKALIDGKANSSHGTHLTLGTGSGNAYYGDKGNTAYTHSQAAHAPSNAQKNSDITKAEIEAKLTGDITSHNHYLIIGTTGTSWTTATRDIQDDCKFEFASHITKSATGLFPVDNNANAIISFNRHSGPHASQLGFSSNGKIYYRWGNGTAITDSTAWQQIYTSSNKPSAADIGAATSGHSHNSSNVTVPKSGSWWNNGLMNVSSDGVMEAGKYLDFHNTNTTTNDFSTRLQSQGDTGNTVYLPTAGGTLSLDGHTHSYLPLSGGTMTGAIKSNSMSGLWVEAANGGALINSTRGYNDFSPMLSGAATNGRMVLALYCGSLMAGYLSKANCDSWTNAVSSTAQIFCENGGAVYDATLQTKYLSSSNNIVSTGGAIWSQNQYVGITDANGSQFRAFFGMRGDRAACEVGDGSVAGQVTVRSGQGAAGSGVTILSAVTNGYNYVQYLSPEAGTIALTHHLSDRTKKENIVYIDSEESEFTNKDFYNFIKDNLDLATYNLKKEYAATDTHTKLNFIAQDILWDFEKNEENKVGNLIVRTEDAMEQQLSLKYDPEIYTSVIAGALKEAISKIEELESERDSLRSEVNNLRTELDELKAIVKGLF